MEFPVFLLNDANSGVSAYPDRATLDAAVITEEDGRHLTAWGSDGERLTITVGTDGWRIAPSEPPEVDLELLRNVLLEQLKYWDYPTASRISRDRIVQRAASYFNVRNAVSPNESLTGQLIGSLFNSLGH